MKLIRTEDAVGQVLCHDMTQIIKDVKKDAVFRKGHVITEEDVPVLLSIGKEHIYVWENLDGMVHENDGAERLRAIAQGENLTATAPKEGKISLKATVDGLLKVNSERLIAVNSVPEVMIATKYGNTRVKEGQTVAAMRVIPLMIADDKLKEAEAAAGAEPIVTVKPFVPKKAAILATGSEIFKGRIKDTFTPVVEEKLSGVKAAALDKRILDDNADMTTAAILDAIDKGAEIVCVTGGMSVDPDDRTPLAIKQTGAQVVRYGTPVLPGAMFMLAYYTKEEADGSTRTVPIVGLPGCVMYAAETVFDKILARLAADDPVTADEIARMGEGGLL